MIKKHFLLYMPDPAEGTVKETPPPETPPAETPPPIEGEKPPVEAPPEEETPPAPEPLKRVWDDPLLASLRRDLDGTDLKITPVEETPPPEKKDEPPKEKPKDEQPPKEEKPKKKKPVIVVKDLDETPAPVPVPIVPAPQPPQPPAPSAQESYVSTLTEEQLQEYQDALFAERAMPEKYKGFSDKILSFYKNFDAWAVKAREENPERSFDENDSGYLEYMRKNKPRIGMADARKVRDGRIREEVADQLRREQEPELEEVKRRQKAQELKPEVDSIVDQFEKGFTELLASKNGEDNPAAEAAAKLGKDAAEAAKEHPMEVEMINLAKERWSKMVREYVLFARKAGRFDTGNAVHSELLEFVNRQGEWFSAKGGKQRINDKGQSFLTRTEFAKLNGKAEQAKHWTFSHRNVLEMMAVEARRETNQAISGMRQQMNRFGYERKGKAPSETPPKKEPEAITPPKSSARAAPGAGVKAKPPAETGQGDAISVRDLYPKEK